VDWDSIDLKVLYASKSIVQIAEELGCSDVAVHKKLKKLGLK
jgi:biotin operon repressor